MKSLDEILYELAEDLTDVQHIKLRTAIIELAEGLVGEDEDITTLDYIDGGGDIAYARNKLRKEIRTAIKEKL